MGKATGKLIVYFEEPFWIGIFERSENGKLCVVKVVFGAKSKNYEVYNFILKNYYSLRFSPGVAVVKETKRNPREYSEM